MQIGKQQQSPDVYGGGIFQLYIYGNSVLILVIARICGGYLHWECNTVFYFIKCLQFLLKISQHDSHFPSWNNKVISGPYQVRDMTDF